MIGRHSLGISSFVFASLMFLTTTTPAQAQSTDSGPLSWFALTPRLWISNVDTVDFDDLVKDTFTVPMAGLTLTIAPPIRELEDLSLALTVLAGAGEGDALYTDFSVVNMPLRADGDVTRTDVELLLRYQLFDSPFSIFIGPRFITFDERYKAAGQTIRSDNDVTALEVGIGAATELNDSGRHRLFANLITGFAVTESKFKFAFFNISQTEERTDPLFDMNAGYQYVFNDMISLAARYRAFMLFTEGDLGTDETFLVHGPEFGLSIRFP